MPQQLLKGDRAIVTGASSGSGSASPEHSRGRRGVIVNFHSDQESAERIVREIRENGGRAEPVQADVSKLATAERSSTPQSGRLAESTSWWQRRDSA